MSFNTITRVNNGILGIYANGNGTLGGNVQVTVTNPPTNTNGMAPPWILDYYGASFPPVRLDDGLCPRDLHRDQQLRRNNGTDTVNLTNTTATTIPSGTNVWALRTAAR